MEWSFVPQARYRLQMAMRGDISTLRAAHLHPQEPLLNNKVRHLDGRVL
jgi:hypothetical protein